MNPRNDAFQLCLKFFGLAHIYQYQINEEQQANYNIMQNYQTLEERLKNFELQLEKRKTEREQVLAKRAQTLAELQEDYEERSNSMISKMQELKRKQTLLITLRKIEPQIPQNFPKNYFCQLVYEDTLLTGSQKFTDFDENVVEQKFVVPLLFSSIVKVEIWSAEEEPALWTKAEINLEKDIESAMISEACEGALPLGKSQSSLTYRLQLQGIGFSTWLRNIVEMRQLEAQKAFSREQAALKKQQMRARLQQKKLKFNQKFERSNKQTTNEYNSQNLNKLLEDLKLE